MSTERKIGKTMQVWIDKGHVDPVTHKMVEGYPNVKVTREGKFVGLDVWVFPAHLRNGYELLEENK